jgi:tRNA pseudouridine13 synthase
MVDLKVGMLAFPHNLETCQRAVLSETPLPLPTARSPMPGKALGELIAGILDSFQLTWNELRIRHLKDVFFSKGTRAALVLPKDLDWAQSPDELHPGRNGLHLTFELPKGSYATILIKRITEMTGPRS